MSESYHFGVLKVERFRGRLTTILRIFHYLHVPWGLDQGLLLPGTHVHRSVRCDRRGSQGGLSTRSIGVARLPAQARLALPKVLLCDLDGTLIDSMPTLADLATEVIEARYATPRILARELYLATCGLPFEKQLEEIFPEDPRNADASAEFEGRKPALCGAIRMAPETRRALQEMRDLGVRIAVSSNNGIENVSAFARDAGFKFDLALGYGDGLAKGRAHLDADVARVRHLPPGDAVRRRLAARR